MNQFERNQRVKVIDPESNVFGKTGTVVRNVYRVGGDAWVNMDETPPEPLYPVGDVRHNWLDLQPWKCEPVELELSPGNKPAI